MPLRVELTSKCLRVTTYLDSSNGKTSVIAIHLTTWEAKFYDLLIRITILK